MSNSSAIKKTFIAIILTFTLFSSFILSIFPKKNVLASDITSSQFAASINTGINLGNSLDACYGEPTGDGNLDQETVWGNPKITKQQIDYIKALGFDVIRIPVTWHTHIYRDEYGVLHIHRDWLNRVKEVVDYCISDGLYVIINSHHDGDIIHAGVTEDAFSVVKSNASALWTEIAAYFSTYDNHLIFESYNELDNYAQSWSYGSRAANQVNELNQIFVDIVRNSGGNNSNRILMIPTLLDKSEYKFQKAFKLPKDTASDKILVTVHDYSQQFDQSIDGTFSNIEKFSKTLGVPIIIGEWGTTDAFIPASYRKIHASNFIARAKSHNIKCIYWDNGSNYAIIDRNELTANSEIISGIMNPTPYQSDSMTILSDWNNFLYMTIEQNTGALIEDKHWGSLVVNRDGNGKCNIPSGKHTLSVSLITNDNMSEQKIHFIYFLDDNKNLLGYYNDPLGYNENIVDIPEGSTYVRIGINNPYSRTYSSEYKDAVKAGNLSFMINYY